MWRYPVKSLLGEQVDAIEVERRGLHLDRRWAVRGADGKLGSGKTTRRFRRMPHLLTMRSRVDNGVVLVEGPGWSGPVDDPATAARVSEVVGEPIELAEEETVRHHDDSPIHLLTDASLAWLRARLPDADIDLRRFRPNLVVTTGLDPGLVEDRWAGRTLAVGAVRLSVVGPAVRCVMAAQPQEELPFAPEIVGELERANELNLGLYLRVESPGSISVGDPVVLT